MAGFKVAKVRKLNIISKPSIDSSIITKIKNTNRKSIYHYDFYFNVDLREALEKNHLKIRFSVRSFTKQEKTSYFGKGKTPAWVLARLYAGYTDSKDELAESNRKGEVFRKAIDLTNQFNNEKLKNAKNISDRSLFGTVMKTKTIPAGSVTKTGKDSTISQRQVNYKIEKEIGYGSFSDNYEYLLKIGKDPSFATNPRQDETPADPRKRGTFVTPNISTGLKGLDGSISQIRNHITGEANTKARTSLREFSNTDNVTVNVKVIDRVRLLKTSVRLTSDMIGDGGNFYICIEAIDSRRKTVGQKLEMKIDHSQNIEDYYVPTEIINFNLASSFASNKKPVDGTISFSDENIRGIEIYRRSIKEPSTYLYSRYSKMFSTQFQNIENAKILTARGSSFGIDLKSKGRLDIFRALTVSKAGATYGNFSSDQLSSGPFCSYRGNFYTTSTPDGIRLKILDVSREVVGVCFMRRDLTNKERSFKKVQPRTDVDQNEATGQSVLKSMVFTTGKKSLLQPSCVDRSVKEDHLYEYKMKLYLKGGTSKFSPCSRIHLFKPPMKSVAVNISDIKYSKKTATQSSRRLEDQTNKAYANVSFNIDYEIAGNNTSDLVELLSAAGLSELYSEELSSVKEQLRSLVTFSVERFNMATGETFHLGTTASGQFTDNGSATPGPAPALGQIYKYRCIPYLVSPEETVREIERIRTPLITPTMVSPSVISDPLSLSTMKVSAQSLSAIDNSPSIANATYASSRASKNYSASSLKKGSIGSATAVPLGSSLSIGSTAVTRFSTGDFYDFIVDTGAGDLDIIPGPITTSGHGGAVLRWDMDPGEGPISSNVDYFVIICQKQNTRYIAGNCHGGNNNSFKFIDFTNKNFIGDLRYSVIPVMLSGATGREAYIGKITQINKNTKLLRGS